MRFWEIWDNFSAPKWSKWVFMGEKTNNHEKSDIRLILSTIKFKIIPSVWSPEHFQTLVIFQNLAGQNAPSGPLGNHMQVLPLGFFINKMTQETRYKTPCCLDLCIMNDFSRLNTFRKYNFLAIFRHFRGHQRGLLGWEFVLFFSNVYTLVLLTR